MVMYDLEKSQQLLQLYGSIDKVPLPFSFRCDSCGRENAGAWWEEEGELVLVCKCGGDCECVSDGDAR